jgi:hypothetical protein
MEAFIKNALSGKKSKDKNNNVKVIDSLYKKPKKDKNEQAVTFDHFEKNYLQQMDLLYLPNDKGFQYALIVVDQGTRLLEAEALKNRSPSDIITALKKIYKRKVLTKPSIVVSDSGSEFKGSFDAELLKMGIKHHKIVKVGRSRSVSLAERKNQTIGTIIHKILVQTELDTGNPSSKWTEYLPLIVKSINEKVTEKLNSKKIKKPIKPKHKVELLDEGDKVRVQLDKPIDISGKKLTGNFRSSDIRWEPEIKTIKYIIQKPESPVLYLLDGNKMGKLKADSTAYTRNQLQPVSTNEKIVENEEPLIENEENRFEVEKIIDRRKIGKSFEYLIKWRNYNAKYNTWEKKAELVKEIPQLIQRFDKKLEKNN